MKQDLIRDAITLACVDLACEVSGHWSAAKVENNLILAVWTALKLNPKGIAEVLGLRPGLRRAGAPKATAASPEIDSRGLLTSDSPSNTEISQSDQDVVRILEWVSLLKDPWERRLVYTTVALQKGRLMPAGLERQKCWPKIARLLNLSDTQDLGKDTCTTLKMRYEKALKEIAARLSRTEPPYSVMI